MDRSRCRVPLPAARSFEKSTDRPFSLSSIVDRWSIGIDRWPVSSIRRTEAKQDRRWYLSRWKFSIESSIVFVRGHARSRREFHGAGEPRACYDPGLCSISWLLRDTTRLPDLKDLQISFSNRLRPQWERCVRRATQRRCQYFFSFLFSLYISFSFFLFGFLVRSFFRRDAQRSFY